MGLAMHRMATSASRKSNRLATTIAIKMTKDQCFQNANSFPSSVFMPQSYDTQKKTSVTKSHKDLNCNKPKKAVVIY